MFTCPPKADVKLFWIMKEMETTKKINALFGMTSVTPRHVWRHLH